jgi:BolA family transcriptional regulator, general stress-responsive regulator
VTTIERIREKLVSLAPEHIEIIDESAQHAGHAGARGGGGHYHLSIVSPRFNGLSMLERHRMIYELLGQLMHKEIHALRIDARASVEPLHKEPK